MIPEQLETDVLVIGAGTAGVCAAIQAARLGCSVILVEKARTLGGNSGPEAGVHPSGAHSFHPYAAETGIIGEIIEEAAWQNAKTFTQDKHYNMSQQWDSVLHQKLKEAGVNVLRCHYAKTPIMEDDRIKAVIVEDIATYHTRRIDIKVSVIESSGDGHVAKEAGAMFVMGREARSEYNERSAPEATDLITMGSSVVGLVRRTNSPVEFIPPPDTPPFYPGYGGYLRWDPPQNMDCAFLFPTETGGEKDTIEDDHEIYDMALKQIYSAWNYIKNEKYTEQSKNWDLVWIGPRVAKRESRRFLGDYVLTQTDVEEGKIFDDAVGYGGYAIDIHEPRPEKPSYVNVIFYSIPPIYTIPYRCLYSRNIDNLFLASRLLSASHMAHGTVRLQRTLSTVGQAAGAAAALCKMYDCRPRDIYKEHMDELKQLLLKEDATVLGIRNTDPEDKALLAKVSATSQTLHEATEFSSWLPMDKARGIMLWDWADRLDTLECYMKNTGNRDVTLKAVLKLYETDKKWKDNSEMKGFPYWDVLNRMEWGGDNSIAIFNKVAEGSSVIPANYEGWVSFGFLKDLVPKDPTSDEARYAVDIEPHPDILWAVDNNYYDFVRRFELENGSSEYTVYPESHMYMVSPRPLYGEAVNVIDGINRRMSTNPLHMWTAKKGVAMPQAIMLEWDKPQSISMVQITFDTIYRAYREMPFDCGKRVSEMCVKNYCVEAWDGSAWHMICEVKDNYHRMRRHYFDRIMVEKLKVTVEDVWDDTFTPRIYEIRVYDSSN